MSVWNLLFKETRGTNLSGEFLLTKLKSDEEQMLICPLFTFLVIYEMKTMIGKKKITLHSKRGALGAPREHLATRQKHASVHFLCLALPLWCVQVTGGVSCDRFDVELLDFIVTSMPTRRAVSHVLHLNNDVSLRHLFKHQSLSTCFPISADYHTIFVGEGCAQI